MGDLSELRDLLKEKQKRLDVVSKKLSIEQGGIQERLKFKSRKLKKGKGDRLEFLKSELNGVKLNYEIEQKDLKSSITAYKDMLEARMKEELRVKTEAFEAKVNLKIEKSTQSYNHKIEHYYHPQMNDLYETEDVVSEEDISLPLAYHKLVNEHKELISGIALLTKAYKGAEEKNIIEMRAAYAAKMAPEPKKKIKLAKKAEQIVLPEVEPQPQVEPTTEQLRDFMDDEWRKKQCDMVRGRTPLLGPEDPFWKQPLEFMGPREIGIWMAKGGFHQSTQSSFQDDLEDKERVKEINSVSLRHQEEAYRAKEIERAKILKSK